MEDKKRYSFCHLAEGKDFKGNDCIVATFDGPIFKPEVKEINGKKLVSGRLPINNQGKRFIKVFGEDIVEKDGVVWVNVVAWQGVAERLEKCIRNSRVFCSILTGIVTKKVDSNENGTFVNLNMIIEDFKLASMPANEKQASTETPNKPKTEKPKGTKKEETPIQTESNEEEDEDDDDLPF